MTTPSNFDPLETYYTQSQYDEAVRRATQEGAASTDKRMETMVHIIALLMWRDRTIRTQLLHLMYEGKKIEAVKTIRDYTETAFGYNNRIGLREAVNAYDYLYEVNYNTVFEAATQKILTDNVMRQVFDLYVEAQDSNIQSLAPWEGTLNVVLTFNEQFDEPPF